MSDTQRRFLGEIAGRVDRDQVVEVHLFHPLRHDGRETGVAVVAVEPQSTPPDAGGDGGVPRHIVYRALYRHTLKGVDRGKWEFELVAEADAPLLAVDDVVRGVHRRVGEDVEPVRLTGEAFRAALVEERWSASAR